MKKSLLTLLVAVALGSANVSAQEEKASGSSASAFAIGDVSGEKVVAGTVAAGILIGMIANNRGSSTPEPVDELEETCDGTDELVDGVCIGNTVTVTTSGTGTVTIPVTFTYAPTLQ